MALNLQDYILRNTTIVTDYQVSLGNLKLRLISNSKEFKGEQFFSEKILSRYRNTKVCFELWCISFNYGSINKKYIISNIDRTYRSNSFAMGYYVTDHFGPQVYLITNQDKFFLFGENLEVIIWSYFVKYFLMLYAIQNNSLFLKSASFSIKNRGTLLFGRGNSGKTTLLSVLCQNGASFITNSHAIIKDKCVIGVGTALRVRLNSIQWKEIILKSKPALKEGEVIVDPFQIFPTYSEKPVALRNICIINFLAPRYHHVEEISSQDTYNYIEQFGLGINVYRLEEDLLDFYGSDYKSYVDAYQNMKKLLHSIVDSSNCYYIRSDILEEENKNEIISLLSK